jgi:hypothetical protein
MSNNQNARRMIMKRILTLSAAISFFVGLLTWPACAALTSGAYQTLPGATVVESGDRVPNDSRVVPYSAFLTFDLAATPPSLTAVISNAVVEGGEPFPLTVRSSFGSRLPDGTYTFRGDYLLDLYPTGSQYGFDWRFSTSTNGEVVWNGTSAWWGGHLWYVAISNLTLVPRPRLEITQSGSQLTVSWPAEHTGFSLEQAAGLPVAEWTAVTNPVDLIGDRFSVTIEAGSAQGYFRLRKP